MGIQLIKLCVGVDDLGQLMDWQVRRGFKWQGQDVVQHVTRNFPRRGDELLDGGSLYWIIRGKIAARNRILGFEECINAKGKPACAIILDTPCVPTEPRAHRPFQGWRYFDPARAPADLPKGVNPDDIPTEMLGQLKDLGLV